MDESLSNIRNILAKVHYDEKDIQRIVSDAGIPMEEVHFNEKPINIWMSALSVAKQYNKICELANIAVENVPAIKAEILKLIEEYEDRNKANDLLAQGKKNNPRDSEITIKPNSQQIILDNLTENCSFESLVNLFNEEYLEPRDCDYSIKMLLECRESLLNFSIGTPILGLNYQSKVSDIIQRIEILRSKLRFSNSDIVKQQKVIATKIENLAHSVSNSISDKNTEV
ncbi:MAG: hypothetical protein ACRBF0_13980 [Calditrichia bacterium]